MTWASTKEGDSVARLGGWWEKHTDGEMIVKGVIECWEGVEGREGNSHNLLVKANARVEQPVIMT